MISSSFYSKIKNNEQSLLKIKSKDKLKENQIMKKKNILKL